LQSISSVKCSIFSREKLDQLGAYIKVNPDATLSELCERFGQKCSLPVMHKITRKMDYVFKKTLKASEREREDAAKKHGEWQRVQAVVDSRRLIFLDESGLKTNMTRLYGRAHKGQTATARDKAANRGRVGCRRRNSPEHRQCFRCPGLV
jgi:hypothetical protein